MGTMIPIMLRALRTILVPPSSSRVHTGSVELGSLQLGCFVKSFQSAFASKAALGETYPPLHGFDIAVLI